MDMRFRAIIFFIVKYFPYSTKLSCPYIQIGHPVSGMDVWESSASENDPGLEQIVDSESDAGLVRDVRRIAPEQSDKFGRVRAKGMIASVINLHRYSNSGAIRN